jgi:dihydrofolate synthase/folylpolyglutamate synthase
VKTIDEALDYLYSFINYETDAGYAYGAVHYNVERTVRLLELLGHPEEGVRVLHVAGTKGKGSVCALLCAVLSAQGHRTGLFTSPHVERVNERVACGGREIEDSELVELMNLFPPLIDRFPKDNVPTTFEILTALAMEHYRRRGAEYAVLETGMGGRFDSTNFCDPLVSVITRISFDHTDKLGDAIEQIAFEKAGIIKRGRPAVVGYQRYSVYHVFEGRAAETASPLYRAEDLCGYEARELTWKGCLFDAVVDGVPLADLFVPLPGRHQIENAVTALLGLKVVGLLPGPRVVRPALGGVRVPARLELFEVEREGGARRVLLDSAHNEDSARTLVRAVREAYRYDRLATVVGVVKGKDVRGILENLAAVSDTLIVTEPLTHKDLDTGHVIRVARELFPRSLYIARLEEALDHALACSGPSDLILVTGSFYSTSPAREILRRRGAVDRSGPEGELR